MATNCRLATSCVFCLHMACVCSAEPVSPPPETLGMWHTPMRVVFVILLESLRASQVAANAQGLEYQPV